MLRARLTCLVCGPCLETVCHCPSIVYHPSGEGHTSVAACALEKRAEIYTVFECDGVETANQEAYKELETG